MAGLWTPGGGRGGDERGGRGGDERGGRGGEEHRGRGGEEHRGDERRRQRGEEHDVGDLSDAGVAQELAALQEQLASTPAATVVANHCFGLFELAALHLSLDPPQLGEAQLAIDALGALVEGLSGRLGEHEATLKEGLAQLRLAFVQIRAASLGRAEPPES